MSRQLTNVGAFVMVAGVIAGGIFAVNELLVGTDPQPEHLDTYESVEGLLQSGGDVVGLLIMLLMAAFVVAVISGRL